MKRHFNKITPGTSKQNKYSDDEGMILTAGGWKAWATKNGYVAENSMSNREGKFIIYDPMHNRTVKVLKKIE